MNVELVAWDIGGAHKYPPPWQQYFRDHFQHSWSLIFALDSSEHDGIIEAREALQDLLNASAMPCTVLLVLANKQDLLVLLALALASNRLVAADSQPCI